MDEELNKLASEIIKEIEREDFHYALKRYGYFKIKTTVKELKEWWDEV